MTLRVEIVNAGNCADDVVHADVLWSVHYAPHDNDLQRGDSVSLPFGTKQSPTIIALWGEHAGEYLGDVEVIVRRTEEDSG